MPLRTLFRRQPKPADITFVLTTSKNYRGVEKNILDPIRNHLKANNLATFRSVPSPEYNQEAAGISFNLFTRHPGDVLMSHGVADKNYFWIEDDDGQPRVNQRKHLFVPGPWLKNRLLKDPRITLKDEQIHCVGWPRLDALLKRQAAYNARKQTKNKKLKVLWAPTHDRRKRGPEQRSTSSYPDFGDYESQLSKVCDFDIALHPRNKRSKKPTQEKLIEADLVISDFGTLVYEAWALGKPVIFPYWMIGERIMEYIPGSAEAYIFENRIGLHADSFDDVLTFINSTSTEPGADVEAFMRLYLPSEYLGNSVSLIAQLLTQLSSEP